MADQFIGKGDTEKSLERNCLLLGDKRFFSKIYSMPTPVTGLSPSAEFSICTCCFLSPAAMQPMTLAYLKINPLSLCFQNAHAYLLSQRVVGQGREIQQQFHFVLDIINK